MAGPSYGRLALAPSDDTRVFEWEMSDVPPHVCIRLKKIFPRIPATKTGPFRFPMDDQTAADLDWFIERYPMQMDLRDRADLRDARRRFEADGRAVEGILLPDYAPPSYAGLREGRALRVYQVQAVEVLRRRRGLLLADEVGLGKTISAIGAMLLPDALPAIVVTQAHVQRQWREQIEAFSSLTVHEIRTTSPYPLPKADVYLFRYSNMAGWTDVIAGWEHQGLAVWDEIQDLRKGTETQKGKASLVLAQKARYRLGLTATPIYNYGAEIWQIMRYIDPEALGSLHEFIREWGVADKTALGTYLRERHALLRRTRTDVGLQLPPVNRIVDAIGYDAQKMHSVDDLARHLAERATTGKFTERGDAVRELDMRVRHATGVAKAPMVADYVRILLAAGEPVLLVGWHRDVYDVWLRRLADFNPALYTGSETAVGKRRSAEAFLAGETPLLIMSLRSGAGLDGLQERCRTVVFGELDWSPGIHHQVIGRLDRDRADGRRERVMAVFLVADEGSDPPMVEVLGLKASQASQIVDPTLGTQRVESDHGHLRGLVQRYLSRRAA